MTAETPASAHDNIDGLFVGLLDAEELRWFDAECEEGRAFYSYEGAAGFLGLAKVRLRTAAELRNQARVEAEFATAKARGQA